MGNPRQKKGRVGKCKTTAKVATACEKSARIGSTVRLFPPGFRPGKMSTILIILASKKAKNLACVDV
ncbi:MAG: hypothetical protein MGU50_02885 [Trichodesmium sp. MAG_R02]|nr:hypothetical protein [Trichodesmium sp. MAG_R02]